MRSSTARRMLSLALVAGAVVLAGCEDTPAPEAGFVTVTLASPNGAEGGAVFGVSGEQVTDADTDAGVAFVRQVEGATRIVVVRDAAGAIRFRMAVENVHQPPTVELVEVSGPDDALRPSLSGYGVEVAR